MADQPAREATSPDPAAALPRDVVRVLDWSRGHLHEPVGLRALARIAGAPPRTLETHFMRFLGTTPLGWVRQGRLKHARRTLLASEGRVTVTDVALELTEGQLLVYTYVGTHEMHTLVIGDTVTGMSAFRG